MTPTQPTFADLIRTARLELDLTQASAAGMLSVSRRTYQYWEDPTRPAPHPLMQEAALIRLNRLKDRLDRLKAI